jgi:drug/metabolite transporter (DMT)-like permease
VITVVSSVIILHETITPLAVVGTALTLTGLIVSQK